MDAPLPETSTRESEEADLEVFLSLYPEDSMGFENSGLASGDLYNWNLFVSMFLSGIIHHNTGMGGGG